MIERIFVTQGIKKIELEEFLRKELDKAGFTKADIVKTPMVTRIIVNVVRPGLAIGRSGQNIKNLTEIIEKRYGIENAQLEIKGIENANLDAVAVVNKMKSLIERGFSWRSVIYKILKDVVDAGAEGIEIIAKGKLTGKGGRKRKVRVIYGYMKKVGDQIKLVDYGRADAYTRAGAIGLKVRIVRPNTMFPDKIDIRKYLLGETAKAEEKAAKEAKVEIAEIAKAETPAEKAEEKIEEAKAEIEKVKEEEKIEEIAKDIVEVKEEAKPKKPKEPKAEKKEAKEKKGKKEKKGEGE